MNTRTALQGALGGYLIAFALNLSASPHHHEIHQPHQNVSNAETAPRHSPLEDGGRADETLYTCSMHPQIRSTDPGGRCPICGMALVMVPQDTSDHDVDPTAASLTLSPRAVALTSIRTEPARYRSVKAQLHLPGRIEIADSHRHTVSARVSGRLERLYINTPGARIQRGDHVADIYSPELLAAQEEFLQAVRMRSQGASGYRAAREKLRLLGIAETALDAIEKSGKARNTMPVTAFGEGVVQTLNVVEGQYLQTGDTLFQIVDLGTVWAVLEAFESDLDFLRSGDEVELTTATHPAQTFKGRIEYIDPWVDSSTRTAGVRVVLENPDGVLKPGVLVNGSVLTARDPAVLIPATAPLFTGSTSLVYVQDADTAGGFSAREVNLGHRLGEYYPVIHGLQAGELVVVQGAVRIDSELQIRNRPSMMTPLGGGAPVHHHGETSLADRPAIGEGTHHTHHGAHGTASGRVSHEHSAGAQEVIPESGIKPGHESVNAALVRELEPLFNAYHQAQQALAEDRLDDWKNATAKLQEASLQVRWPDFLQGVDDQLQEGRIHLEHIRGLDRAGALFYRHSQAMMTMARMGLASGTWFVAFCPMASAGDGNGAHWLQRDDRLSNPYFGQSMLRCGDMQETLEGRSHE